MAGVPEPYQGTDLAGGVLEVVRTHHTPRVRRDKPPAEGPQRELCHTYREELPQVLLADHLSDLRPADTSVLRRAQRRGEDARILYGRHYGHIAVQHSHRYGQHQEPLRYTRPEEDHHRPAVEPQLHIRHTYRGRMQPSGSLGRHDRGAHAGIVAVQPLIYIWRLGSGQDAHRAGHRSRRARTPSRTAGALRLDKQVSGAVPDSIQER